MGGGGAVKARGRCAAELRPAVLDVRRERGDRDVAGEKEEKRLSPGYTCARVIAGAPGHTFAGDKYTPGEARTWCAGNNPGIAITWDMFN
jgi:hypothetical protein